MYIQEVIGFICPTTQLLHTFLEIFLSLTFYPKHIIIDCNVLVICGDNQEVEGKEMLNIK